VSKGGNYLLNVRPDLRGIVPQPSQDNLRAVGEWLKMNGEAIYGAGRSPFGEEFGDYAATQKGTDGKPLFLSRTDWRCTTKPGKLYFEIFKTGREGWTDAGVQERHQVGHADRRDGPPQGARGETSSEGVRTIDVPRMAVLDTMGAVIVVEIEGDKVER